MSSLPINLVIFCYFSSKVLVELTEFLPRDAMPTVIRRRRVPTTPDAAPA